MARYRLTQKADEDLSDIFNYGIDHFGVDTALEFYHELCSMFDKIATNPNHFQSVEDTVEPYSKHIQYTSLNGQTL